MNNTNTCKNCKYFDSKHNAFPDKTDGLCLKLGLNKHIISDVIAKTFIYFAQDQNPSFVRVGFNFGCIHFINNKTK